MRLGRTPRLLLLAALATLLLAAAAGILARDLPGPRIKERLGLDEPPAADPCEPSPARVRRFGASPAGPGWRPEPAAPDDSPEAAAAALGARVFVAGGQKPKTATAALWRFDPDSGGHVREPDSPVSIDHPVLAARGDEELVLASGYIDGADATNRAWAWSAASRRWRELPPMRVARGGAGGGVIGDRLYVAGGTPIFGEGGEPLASLEIYDFGERRWLPGTDMPTGRHHVAAAVAGGRLYVAGGRRGADLSVDAFESFDPASGRWERLAPLPHGLAAGALAAVGGRLVLTGGGDDEGWQEGRGWVTPAVWEFDPGDGRWRRLADLRTARHGHVSAAVDGRLYVLRGSPCPGYGRTATVESLALR